MASQRISVVVSMRLSWWVEPYIYGCWLVSIVTGLEPDHDKIAGFIARHGVKLLA